MIPPTDTDEENNNAEEQSRPPMMMMMNDDDDDDDDDSASLASSTTSSISPLLNAEQRNLSDLGEPTKLLRSVKSHSADDFKREREEIVP